MKTGFKFSNINREDKQSSNQSNFRLSSVLGILFSKLNNSHEEQSIKPSKKKRKRNRRLKG